MPSKPFWDVVLYTTPQPTVCRTRDHADWLCCNGAVHTHGGFICMRTAPQRFHRQHVGSRQPFRAFIVQFVHLPVPVSRRAVK